MSITLRHQSFIRAALAGVAVVASLMAATPAFAQLDPLIGVKRLPPNVIVVLDTSFTMLTDGEGNYYDVKTYNRTDDVAVANALGIATSQYRRIYRGLAMENTQSSTSKYFTLDIAAVPSSAASYSTFWNPTRFQMAKMGIAQAVSENPLFVRWGLLKLRQEGEAWRDVNSTGGCDRPVRVTGNPALTSVNDTNPCPAGGLGLGGGFVIYAPSTNAPNISVTPGPGDSVVHAVGSSNVVTNMLATLNQPVGSGVLIPAGRDTSTYVDRPVTRMLTDAKFHIQNTSFITGDSCRACRNTVVVLIVGGKDGGDSAYLSTHDAINKAQEFESVAINGASRRVPIVVIGVKPAAADEAQLQGIANASGGRYFRATSATDVSAAVNYAVQLGYAKAADVDAGRESEYSFVSPIVGSVNLAGAQSATGATLSDTDILSTGAATSGQSVPQRSNFMITGGFALPSFDGRLRAFRVFKPEVDSTKPTGWKFVKDGTRLWPDLDDRPHLAGMARAPFNPDSRNIYTFIPDGAGGGQMVAFTLANSGMLSAHLGGADPTRLIPFVRSQAIGALINSTPAIMDAPSLDPPPDADYGFPDSVNTFAGNYKNRRAMIFFGANDGMIHAVDARTGYEVWAFIPYNLLPKLRTLLDGQPVERFAYFNDSSPKIAEVKVNGAWRSMLVIGQGYGGTFYQAFDVTEAGMGVPQTADGISAVTSMLARFDAPGESIQFSWAFPNYSSFNPNVNVTASLADGFPGAQVTFFGDLKATATNVEKRVGFTFSDPAVGPMNIDRTVSALITGSGYFPEVEDNLPGRGTGAPRAGRSLFVLNIATGTPLGNASGGSCSGVGCYDVGDQNNGRKNTIQADVTAAGESGSHVVSKAYVGDSDGKYWRFTLNETGAITATSMVDTNQPIYSSSALLFVGTTERYLFFGTGSDLLANTTPGGGSSGGTAFKLYGIKDGASSGTVVFTRDLAPVFSGAGTLLTNGERPTSSPTVAGDIVFFTTTTDVQTIVCNSDATSKLYAFTYLGSAAYDTSGNGKIDTNESPVIATTQGRGTAPFIVDQHLFVGATSKDGVGVAMFGDAEDFNNGVGQVGVRILSWREIR